MTNMLPEKVDVTNFIKSGEYFPDSCEGQLVKLIKSRPLTLDSSYENELQVKLNKWELQYNNWLKKNNKDTVKIDVDQLFQHTTYQYSYLLFFRAS